jgi:glycosyltransferase involved in cell wall biosynthesis
MHVLAAALAHRGNHVTTYALNPPREAAGYDYRPIPVPDALRGCTRTALYLTPWWVSRIRFDSFDVVHAHGDDHFIRTRRPVVRTFYGAARAEASYSTTLRHRLYHMSMVPFELVSERRATEVVAISRITQQYLTRQAVLIPCGYDPRIFFPAGVKSAHPSILFVGDLDTRKRGHLLLEVFARVVRAAIPIAELWMVTTDSVAAPGVRSLGRVSTPALADLYRQAWVFCLPSLYEGFGVPYIEAMACGTPVVATPNGGAEDVLEGGRSGRIVEDGQLGPELVRLLTDGDARNALAASGLARAKEYEIARIAERYERLYQRVAGTILERDRSGERSLIG